MTKTILITGASTGIGRATAELFAERGWNVVATMRTPSDGDALAERDNVLVTRLDVLDAASIEAALAEGIARFGAIDAVLNNAGYAVMGPFEATNAAETERQFDVNVLGLLRVTQAALPHFRERGSGLFLNVSSMGGRTTFPLLSLYHATKWAVEGFSESIHYELLPLGIGVKLIEPGAIATDFGSRSMTFAQPTTTEAYNGMMGTVQAMFEGATYGTPQMVAETIYTAATDGRNQLRYLAGDDAEAILAQREAAGDEPFLAGMRAQLGLVAS
ncbi:MAG: SDR family oxidoreductase [Bacteroidota bacterium]